MATSPIENKPGLPQQQVVAGSRSTTVKPPVYDISQFRFSEKNWWGQPLIERVRFDMPILLKWRGGCDVAKWSAVFTSNTPPAQLGNIGARVWTTPVVFVVKHLSVSVVHPNGFPGRASSQSFPAAFSGRVIGQPPTNAVIAYVKPNPGHSGLVQQIIKGSTTLAPNTTLAQVGDPSAKISAPAVLVMKYVPVEAAQNLPSSTKQAYSVQMLSFFSAFTGRVHAAPTATALVTLVHFKSSYCSHLLATGHEVLVPKPTNYAYGLLLRSPLTSRLLWWSPGQSLHRQPLQAGVIPCPRSLQMPRDKTNLQQQLNRNSVNFNGLSQVFTKINYGSRNSLTISTVAFNNGFAVPKIRTDSISTVKLGEYLQPSLQPVKFMPTSAKQLPTTALISDSVGRGSLATGSILDLSLSPAPMLDFQIKKEMFSLALAQTVMPHLPTTEEGRLIEDPSDDERHTLIEDEKKTIVEVKVADEPVTVVISQNGWYWVLQGHGHGSGQFQFQAGDALYATFECRSVDYLIALGSNGHVYSVAVNTLLVVRGAGQLLSGFMEPEANTRLLHFHAGSAEDRLLLATSHGYGFIASVGDMSSRQPSSKRFIHLDEGAVPLAPMLISSQANALACLSEYGRLLVFSLDEVKNQGSGGRGAILQQLESREKLLAALPITRDGLILSTHDGSQEQLVALNSTELALHYGERGDAGRAIHEPI